MGDKKSLFAFFMVEPVVDAVKDIYVPVSWQVMTKIIEDNWPIRRHFPFSLMSIRVLLPQPQMAKGDAFYHVGFANSADDSHHLVAARTTERVHFPDLLDELSPVTADGLIEGTRGGL